MKAGAPIMPHLLYVAVQVGGRDAARKLSKAFGGKRVYIPGEPPPPNHPLVLAAGQAVADALVKIAGTRRVEFPKGEHAMRVMIAAEIVASGGSNDDIREACGTTHRNAKRLRHQLAKGIDWGPLKGLKVTRPRDPRQMDIEDLLPSQ